MKKKSAFFWLDCVVFGAVPLFGVVPHVLFGKTENIFGPFLTQLWFKLFLVFFLIRCRLNGFISLHEIHGTSSFSIAHTMVLVSLV